jgi:3'(2'), 5'-bisphosphate nucleotidase
MLEPPESILPQIASLAREASDVLVNYCRASAGDLGLEWKGENDPVTEADKAVHELCAARLPRILPDVPLMGEEGGAQDGADQFWSLDPLDGTAEFVDHLGEWAFQLALVREGSPVLAVVALPAVDRFYLAVAGSGCTSGSLSDWEARRFSSFAPLRNERLVLTRSMPRRPSLSRLVELHPATECVLLGGVGYKVHAVLAGEGDTYFAVPGTLHPWDLAAPLLVAREAGLRCRTLAGGSPSVPSDRNPIPEGLLVTRPAWLERNLAFFARADIAALVAKKDPR